MTPTIAREILIRHQAGQTLTSIATSLGISQAAVWNVWDGRKFRDVAPDLPRRAPVDRTGLQVRQQFTQEEVVRRALRRPALESSPDLAHRLGISAEHLANIRAGRRLAHVLPELPRPGGIWPVVGHDGPSPESLVRALLDTYAHLPGKEVAPILGIKENRVYAIRIGRTLRDVLPELPRLTPKVRPGRASRLSQEAQEELVRDALAAMGRRAGVTVAKAHGVSRQYVCTIQAGEALVHILPHLPRKGEAPSIPCFECTFYGTTCQLGLPEAGTIDAIGCGAFAE